MIERIKCYNVALALWWCYIYDFTENFMSTNAQKAINQ